MQSAQKGNKKPRGKNQKAANKGANGGAVVRGGGGGGGRGGRKDGVNYRGLGNGYGRQNANNFGMNQSGPDNFGNFSNALSYGISNALINGNAFAGNGGYNFPNYGNQSAQSQNGYFNNPGFQGGNQFPNNGNGFQNNRNGKSNKKKLPNNSNNRGGSNGNFGRGNNNYSAPFPMNFNNGGPQNMAGYGFNNSFGQFPPYFGQNNGNNFQGRGPNPMFMNNTFPEGNVRRRKRIDTDNASAAAVRPDKKRKVKKSNETETVDNSEEKEEKPEPQIKINRVATEDEKETAAQKPITDDEFKAAFVGKFLIYETVTMISAPLILQYSAKRNYMKYRTDTISTIDLEINLLFMADKLICKGKFRKDVYREGLLRFKKFCPTLRHEMLTFSNFGLIDRHTTCLEDISNPDPEKINKTVAATGAADGGDNNLQLKPIKKIIKQFIAKGDRLDLGFSPDYTKLERRKIKDYLDNIKEGISIEMNHHGLDMERNLFVSLLSQNVYFLNLIEEQKYDDTSRKYHIFLPTSDLQIDVLGKCRRDERDHIASDIRAKQVNKIIEKESYTAEELPFADKLKDFVLFKLSDAFINSVTHSTTVNKRSCVVNPTKNTAKLYIDDIFICEAPRQQVHKAAMHRLEHVCYTVVRLNVLPKDIKIFTRATLDAYKDIDLSKYTVDGDIDEMPAGKGVDDGLMLSRFLAMHLLDEQIEKNGHGDFAFNNEFTRAERSFIRDYAKTKGCIGQMTNVDGHLYMIVTYERPMLELLKIIQDKSDDVINQRYVCVPPKLAQFH